MAEGLAALWFLAKGYRIVARRVKLPGGEIDLIARRGSLTVFVEVKFRRERGDHAAVLGMVNAGRIRRAADVWLSRNAQRPAGDVRFDVLVIYPWRVPLHMKAMF